MRCIDSHNDWNYDLDNPQPEPTKQATKDDGYYTDWEYKA